MDFRLPMALGQDLLKYLQEQPYKDVAHLIAGIQQLESVPEKKVRKPKTSGGKDA